jgi:hypothetical protein
VFGRGSTHTYGVREGVKLKILLKSHFTSPLPTGEGPGVRETNNNEHLFRQTKAPPLGDFCCVARYYIRHCHRL